MGYLRLLLASLVLSSHVTGFTSNYVGAVAVECFYVISGFYIQMIIHEYYKGQTSWRRKFWESRALRIFVPYWAVLGILYLLIPVLRHLWDGSWHFPDVLRAIKYHPLEARTWLELLPNIFILGSEHIKMLIIVYQTYNPMMIAQAWSIGIELLFYAIAPFLLMCRARVLVVSTLCGYLGKLALFCMYPDMPFHYSYGDILFNTIFPLELCLFTTGALSYRFYARYLRERALPNTLRLYILLLVCITLASIALALGMKTESRHHFVGIAPYILYYAYVAFIALLVPFLFRVSRNFSKDRLIGNCSYSFYLMHCYMMSYAAYLWPDSSCRIFIVAEILTLAGSLLIGKFIEAPLDRFRDRRFRRTHTT